jgi:hypothetical protein
MTFVKGDFAYIRNAEQCHSGNRSNIAGVWLSKWLTFYKAKKLNNLNSNKNNEQLAFVFSSLIFVND